MKHKQCVLVKGNVHLVAWIPETLAIRGRYVRLFSDNSWYIHEVYQNRQEIKDLREKQRVNFGSIVQ